MMQTTNMIHQLEANSGKIQVLAEGIPDAQSRWKPDADTWSVLEVLGHLLDEERMDFRVRLEYTLQRTGESWPPINPVGWVAAHHYNEGDLEEILQGFLAAREDSLRWLRTLDPLDLGAVYQAPFGEIRAGDLLAAWAAHDLLHMRQLLELQWAWLEREVEPYRTLYAGEWG